MRSIGRVRAKARIGLKNLAYNTRRLEQRGGQSLRGLPRPPVRRGPRARPHDEQTHRIRASSSKRRPGVAAPIRFVDVARARMPGSPIEPDSRPQVPGGSADPLLPDTNPLTLPKSDPTRLQQASVLPFLARGMCCPGNLGFVMVWPND